MVILAAFGPAEAFAAVGGDGRLQLWDAVTGRPKHEYVEKKHFQHSYTCLAYGSSAAGSAKAKRKDKEGQDGGFVALGTSDGKIVLWDLRRGVVAHVLGSDANLPAVTDVAFSRDGKYVYASYADYGSVLQWDVASGQQQAQLPGDKKGVRRLAFNPKTNLIAIASSSLRLMEAGDGSGSTGRRRKLQTRHSSGISLVKFSRDGRYVVTAGVGTRFVHLFAVESTDNNAIATVAFPGVPTHLDVLATSASGGVLVDIVAALEDGGVAVVRQFVSADGAAGETQTCTVTLGNSATKVKALAARFLAAGEALIARGSVGKLSFTRLNYTNETGEIVATVDIEAATTQDTVVVEEHKQVDAQGEQEEIHVIGLRDMGEKKRPKLADADEREGDDETAAAAKKRSRSGSLDLSTVPLAERLAALSEQLTREEKQEFAAKKKATGPQPPRAESLATVLEQALQAKDDALLEQCLSCTDPAIIDSTAARLSPARALPFLTKLVAKFEKKPSRGSLLTHWLMAVLKKHSAFLVTVPDLARHLGGVSQLLENRLATYSKLAALGGRLELILAQVHQQKEFSQLRQGPAEPLATYNEEDDDEEGDEDYEDENEDDEDAQEEEDMILNGELGSDEDDVQEHDDDDDEDYEQEDEEEDDDDDDA